MKDTVKLFSIITGIYRSLVTILFLLGIGFTILVDTSLLISFLDLLGFQGISASIVKPIFILIFALLFIVNFIITRHIYKAGDTGEYHLSNFVFGLLFLALTIFFYITFRNLTTNIIFVIFALNGLLVLNSLLGLIAKTRGLYLKENKYQTEANRVNDFIEFDDIAVEKENQTNKNIEVGTVVENTDEIKVVKDNKKSTDKNPKVNQETKAIDQKKIVKNNKAFNRKLVEKGQKMVFESNDKATSKNEEKTPKITTNKTSYGNKEKDGEIYGEDEAVKIKKEKEDKVFDKSQFTRIKIDDINKDKK